jgi:hypothetical protein
MMHLRRPLQIVCHYFPQALQAQQLSLVNGVTVENAYLQFVSWKLHYCYEVPMVGSPCGALIALGARSQLGLLSHYCYEAG